MAHRHSRGQIVVEATIVILVLAMTFILIATHLSFVKDKFERMEITRDGNHEYKTLYRKK